MAGHGAAELEAGDVSGHDPGQLLDAGLPGGDAHVRRGRGHDELLVGADVEVVVEAGLVVDAEGDRLAGRHRDVAHLGAGRVGELQGAGGHQLDDAGLAGGRDRPRRERRDAAAGAADSAAMGAMDSARRLDGRRPVRCFRRPRRA